MHKKYDFVFNFRFVMQKIYDFAYSLGKNLIFQKNFNFFNIKKMLISFVSVVGNITDT
jgi:hypothetical protein